MSSSSANLTLPIPAAPSRRTIDQATLFRVCSWADEGEVERAGDKAVRLLRDGIYDFQLVMLWLACRFARDGISSLAETLEAAVEQLRVDLDAAAPADEGSVARYLDRAMAWLANNLTHRIHFHCKVRDETWTRWLKDVHPTFMDTMSSRITWTIGELERRLEVVAGPTSPGEIHKLQRRFRSGFGGIAEQLALEAAEAAPTPEKTPPEVDSKTAEVEGEPRPAPTGQAPEQARVVGSSRLQLLQSKLAGFEQFVRREAWTEAAIVARDVEQELSHFDPLLYLPEMFSGYLHTLHGAGAELEEHMVDAGRLEQRALERLYHSDPLGFLLRAQERAKDE